MRISLYCLKEKEDNDFSKEHAIPKSLGGALEPKNPFALYDVCRQCNNLLGRIVDGPFVKEFHLRVSKEVSTNKFIRFTNNSTIPFRHIGKLQDITLEESVCDFWIGPDKSYIYHFHEPYKTQEMPPLRSDKEEIVFIFIRTNNPNWEKIIFNSLKLNFKKSKFYLGNRRPPIGSIFARIPKSFKQIHEKLKFIQNKKHTYSISSTTEYFFPDRFYAKVALGLGSIILGQSYKFSNSAAALRNYMWDRDIYNRRKSNLVLCQVYNMGGSNTHFEDWQKRNEFFKWEGGHTIVLRKTEKELSLYLNFYENNGCIVLLCNENNYWKNKLNDDICYVIVPGLQAVVGPIPLQEFADHKHGNTFKNKELMKLKELMEKYKHPPSFFI